MWCDGRRRFDLPATARVEVRRGALPVLLARVGGHEEGTNGGGPFTDRLVAKFGLPVTGWRGRISRGSDPISRGEDPPQPPRGDVGKETAGGHA